MFKKSNIEIGLVVIATAVFTTVYFVIFIGSSLLQQSPLNMIIDTDNNNNNNNNNNNTQKLNNTQNLNDTQKRKCVELLNISNIECPNKCWMNINNDKLIIFLHFHKAGGTSIVSSASCSNIFAKESSNGNPKKHISKYEKYNYRIPYWQFNLSQFIFFIKQLNINNTSFIAIENEYFINVDPNIIINSNYVLNVVRYRKIELITQFRDPFDRYLSAFFYEINTRWYRETNSMKKNDIKQRLLSFHNIEGYEKKGAVSGNHEWNMYIRIFRRKFNNTIKINETDLFLAQKELDKFNTITILEIKETHKLLEYKYGIYIDNKKIKQKGRGDKNKLTSNDKNILNEFKNEFKIYNKWDYLLYDYAVNLSHNMLSQIDKPH